MKHAPARLALLVLTLASGLDGTTVRAQTQLETFREEITIRARPFPSDASGGVTVIDRETIESSGVRTVADLLRYVAGVQVVSSGARGGLTQIQIRGGDPNFTLVLLDGVPLNDSTNTEGGAYSLASLPAKDVERVEVARGPLSYYYGSYALSGIVNIVTRRGTEKTAGAEVALEAGNASLLRASTSFKGATTGTDYYVGVGWEREAERVASEDFEQLNVQTSVGAKLGETARLRVASRFASTDGSDYPEASGGPRFGAGELRTFDQKEASLGVELAFSETARLRHRVATHVAGSWLDRTSPGVAPLVPPSVEETTFSRARFAWLGTSPVSSRAQLSLGADLERETGANESVLLLPPFLGGAVAGDYDLNRWTPGGFVELVTEQGPFLLEGGMRTDFPRNLPVEWSPRIAIRYRPRGALALSGSLSRAFKLPSFFVLGSPPALGGNPGLLPETSIGGDLRVEIRNDARALSASAGVFHNQYRDLIDFDFGTFSFVNRARVEATGVEISARYRPQSFSFEVDWTFQRVQDPTSIEQPLHQPNWYGSARARFEPAASFAVHVEGRFGAGSLDRQLTVPDRDRVDGYAVLDVGATYRISERFKLHGRIENLTNGYYENLIGFPEPGLAARLGITYTRR